MPISKAEAFIKDAERLLSSHGLSWRDVAAHQSDDKDRQGRLKTYNKAGLKDIWEEGIILQRLHMIFLGLEQAGVPRTALVTLANAHNVPYNEKTGCVLPSVAEVIEKYRPIMRLRHISVNALAELRTARDVNISGEKMGELLGYIKESIYGFEGRGAQFLKLSAERQLRFCHLIQLMAGIENPSELFSQMQQMVKMATTTSIPQKSSWRNEAHGNDIPHAIKEAVLDIPIEKEESQGGSYSAHFANGFKSR